MGPISDGYGAERKLLLDRVSTYAENGTIGEGKKLP